MRVRIDEARCQGHGRCYGLAPAVFESDEEGSGQVVADPVPTGEEEAAQLAVANCPERAILIED
jgi:ferredoxin